MMDTGGGRQPVAVQEDDGRALIGRTLSRLPAGSRVLNVFLASLGV